MQKVVVQQKNRRKKNEIHKQERIPRLCRRMAGT